MEISVLQSLIDRNSNRIRKLEQSVEDAKYLIDELSDKYNAIFKKEIARLVKNQKALKKEIARQISHQKLIKRWNKFREEREHGTNNS